MVHLTLTKKMADKFKIDTSKAFKDDTDLPELDDWIVDDVWDSKRDPWVLFYHKPSTFSVIVQPDKYKLEHCADLCTMLIQELLIENDLFSRMHYFMQLFNKIQICRNNDKSSVAYMTQIKTAAYFGVHHPYTEHGVESLYELMLYVNRDYRKKFNMAKKSIDVFLEMVSRVPPYIPE